MPAELTPLTTLTSAEQLRQRFQPSAIRRDGTLVEPDKLVMQQHDGCTRQHVEGSEQIIGRRHLIERKNRTAA